MSENQLTVAEAQPPQQLITIEPAKYVALVFEPFAKRLADAKTLAEAATFDVTTTAGMAVAVKHRATFRDIRVASEKARKERKAPILEIGKLLDSRQKEIEAEIEPYESRFDDAIKAEEARKEAEKQAKAAAEKARVVDIRKRIAEIQAIPAMLVGKQSETIAAAIESLETVAVTLDDFSEFSGEAEMVKIAAVAKLGEMLTAQLAAEAEAKRLQQEREELARLRAEAEERERVAAVERAEQERVARAAREAEEEKLRQQREAHEAELRRQREAEEVKLAEQRTELARQQAEIDRQRAEAERIERERQAAIEAEARAKREADEAAARAESEKREAALRAEAIEKARRIREDFELNGPHASEMIEVLAAHYQVEQETVLQWINRWVWAEVEIPA